MFTNSAHINIPQVIRAFQFVQSVKLNKPPFDDQNLRREWINWLHSIYRPYHISECIGSDKKTDCENGYIEGNAISERNLILFLTHWNMPSRQIKNTMTIYCCTLSAFCPAPVTRRRRSIFVKYEIKINTDRLPATGYKMKWMNAKKKKKRKGKIDKCIFEVLTNVWPFDLVLYICLPMSISIRQSR